MMIKVGKLPKKVVRVIFRIRKKNPDIAAIIMAGFLILQLAVFSFLFVVLPVQAASTIIFEDHFDQSGSGLENGWSTFSGSSASARKITDSPNNFVVGLDGTKGMLFEGSSSPNPDDGVERNIATMGNSELTVEYSRIITGLGSGDEFVAQYSLDEGPFVTLETLTLDQAHSGASFDITNPDRKTKLTLRFFVNANNIDDRVGIDDLAVEGDNSPLFYDGFESDDFSTGGWVTSETSNIKTNNDDAWTDSNINPPKGRSAEIDGSTGVNPDDAIVKSFSTAGLEKIKVRYARKIEGLSGGEAFNAQYSVDGSNWLDLEAPAGDSDYQSILVALPSTADNNPDFKIRFQMNGSGAGDNLFVDDVVIFGELQPTTGTIIIKKIATPEDGQDFEFTRNFGENFSLDNDADGILSNEITFSNIEQGSYAVIESALDGWNLANLVCDDPDEGSSEDLGARTATIDLDANETVTCAFTNEKLGSITVIKVADPSEDSFVFTLSGPTPGETTIQGSDSFTFDNLLAGSYSLSEPVLEGWSQTVECTEGDLSSLVLDPGENISCVFNNTQLATISGKKFHDLNANGVDDDEPGLSDWSIVLSQDGEEGLVIVGTEDTEEGGFYIFSNLLPGTYHVCEEQQEDWFQSFPQSGYSCGENGLGYEVVLGAGANIVSQDFGNYRKGSISGKKFNELEAGLSGWTIELYSDDEESLLNNQETGEDGSYLFSDLIPGTYVVKEVSQVGWVALSPIDPASHTVSLSSGDTAIDKDFVNKQDVTDPVSYFEAPQDYQMIDTEIVALELRGVSQDDLTGIQSVSLLAHKIMGEQGINNFPSQSFFDIFTELDCQNFGENHPIQTELVALNLVSVNPLTVTWSPSQPWMPNEPGVYCFEAHATDNAGNFEDTAYAGPIAYAPVPEISNEATILPTDTSITITWLTDHPATSRVIYDTVFHAGLGEAPNYGYAFSTSETDLDLKVTSHSVLITGLTAETTYFYRAVSKGSPEGIGSENTFGTLAGGGGSDIPYVEHGSGTSDGGGSSGGGSGSGGSSSGGGSSSSDNGGGSSGSGSSGGESSGSSESDVQSLQDQLSQAQNQLLAMLSDLESEGSSGGSALASLPENAGGTSAPGSESGAGEELAALLPAITPTSETEPAPTLLASLLDTLGLSSGIFWLIILLILIAILIFFIWRKRSE
ncbi:MAG: hypothetical protein A3J53_03385 [Candidatus Harrisonbacteria bacterium RIFCSPHIGHO2_02_FULL_40_20]|nr:MAG: hypothetical protein A3J53_03385 [Candidatus Harrisonbacteria bacterium RIFCSPHIGHO2_02_FULL_40_20]